MKQGEKNNIVTFTFDFSKIFYDLKRVSFLSTRSGMFDNEKIPEYFILHNPDSNRKILFKKNSNYRNENNQIIFWEYIAIRNHRWPCYFVVMNIPKESIEKPIDLSETMDTLMKQCNIVSKKG